MALKLCLRLLQRTNYGKTVTSGIVGSRKTSAISDRIAVEVAGGCKRLFAVVYIKGRQYKVGENDLISVCGNLPVDVGDRINLEKVLLLGGKNFTLIGRPTLQSPSVTVTATVVEKTTSYPKVKYNQVSDAGFTKLDWLSNEQTVLRINGILLNENLVENIGSS